jgi:hypothetical protein
MSQIHWDRGPSKLGLNYNLKNYALNKISCLLNVTIQSRKVGKMSVEGGCDSGPLSSVSRSVGLGRSVARSDKQRTVERCRVYCLSGFLAATI